MIRSTCLSVLMLALTGCSLPANPGTTVEVDPVARRVYVYDTKDNDITIEGLDANFEAKSIKVERFSIVNNASRVREANVQQITAYTEQVRAVTSMVTSLGEMVRTLIPYALPARAPTSTGIGFDPTTGRIDLSRTGGGTTVVPLPVPTTNPSGANP